MAGSEDTAKPRRKIVETFFRLEKKTVKSMGYPWGKTTKMHGFPFFWRAKTSVFPPQTSRNPCSFCVFEVQTLENQAKTLENQAETLEKPMGFLVVLQKATFFFSAGLLLVPCLGHWVGGAGLDDFSFPVSHELSAALAWCIFFLWFFLCFFFFFFKLFSMGFLWFSMFFLAVGGNGRA